MGYSYCYCPICRIGPVSIQNKALPTLSQHKSVFSVMNNLSLCSPVPAGSSNSRGPTQAIPRRSNLRNGGAGGPVRAKDDECFGDGTDNDLDTDFDFEGNLALFDKAAVFSQIDGSSSHGHKAQLHGTHAEQKPLSYRHDENILEGKPVTYRQITVPQHGGKEYCTGE